jgi:GAF domain-containing protein
MHDLRPPVTVATNAGYPELARSLEALLAGEPNVVSCAANTVALLYHGLADLNWVGFYLLDPASGDLLVGPFQGRPACVRIPLGRGVCGTAAAQRRTLVVPDVHAFPDHIACDAASNSELVVPVIDRDQLIGVLDLDSPLPGRFDAADARGVEALVEVFVRAVRA